MFPGIMPDIPSISNESSTGCKYLVVSKSDNVSAENNLAFTVGIYASDIFISYCSPSSASPLSI